MANVLHLDDFILIVNGVKNAPITHEPGRTDAFERSVELLSLPTRWGFSASGPLMNSTAPTATSGDSFELIARLAGGASRTRYFLNVITLVEQGANGFFAFDEVSFG